VLGAIHNLSHSLTNNGSREWAVSLSKLLAIARSLDKALKAENVNFILLHLNLVSKILAGFSVPVLRALPPFFMLLLFRERERESIHKLKDRLLLELDE
jgi:hypothetical protein